MRFGRTSAAVQQAEAKVAAGKRLRESKAVKPIGKVAQGQRDGRGRVRRAGDN